VAVVAAIAACAPTADGLLSGGDDGGGDAPEDADASAESGVDADASSTDATTRADSNEGSDAETGAAADADASTIADARAEADANAAPARIYVADYAANVVRSFDDMTGANPMTLPATPAESFSFPTGVFVDAANRIYVADSGNHRVVRVDDMTGAGWIAFTLPPSDAGTLARPEEVAVSPAGTIVVADFANYRLVVMDDMAGTNLRTYQRYGTGTDQSSGVCGLAFDPLARLYFTDGCTSASNNERVVRVDAPDGSGWTALGGGGDAGLAPGQFDQPDKIALDGAGRVYVVEHAGFVVSRFDDMTGAGWTTLGAPGVSGVQQGQFQSPSGVAVDATGRVYVADGNRIVRVDDMSGAGWVTLGELGSGVTFQLLNAIAVR
jgi:sugar lactone lactonase YvrE